MDCGCNLYEGDSKTVQMKSKNRRKFAFLLILSILIFVVTALSYKFRYNVAEITILGWAGYLGSIAIFVFSLLKLYPKTKGYIVGIGLILVLVIGSIIFGRQTALNSGGKVIFSIAQDEIEFNKDTQSTVDFPFKMDFYPGSGWDNICFEGTILWYVQPDTLIPGDVIEAGRFSYETINHDADKRNLPYSPGYKIILTLSKYDLGKYKLVLRNFVSTLNDRPYSGLCSSKGIWDNLVKEADKNYDVSTEPDRWISFITSQTYVISEGSAIKKFIITGEKPPVDESPAEPEQPTVPNKPEPGQPETSLYTVPGIILALIIIIIIVLIYRTRRQ